MLSPVKKLLLATGGVVGLVFALVIFNALRYLVFWFPTEAVSFASGDVTIAGTLIKPSDTGPFPAVIILHGSGPESMEGPGYRLAANMFARSGFAVLLYDKRGVGESSGDFESAQFSDFIADAVAAVEYLAGREDIDAGNIGVQGNSEGGWFTPEVAHTTGKVAFIFNRVGPPLPWMENVIWEGVEPPQ